MKPTDYRSKYKLEEKSAEVSGATLQQAIANAMNGSTFFRTYFIRKKKTDDLVIFGREDYVKMNSNDSLLLLRTDWSNRDIPSVVLRYGVYPKRIVVGYIQTPYEIDFENYNRIKSDLEMRPHEMVFAHFLDRISGTLNHFPDTNVFFSPFYLDKPLYPFLRDRFLDKSYFLNPRRERVRQIMGEDNSWLRGKNVQERFIAQKGIKADLLIPTKFLDIFV